jgi:hypothetical protein
VLSFDILSIPLVRSPRRTVRDQIRRQPLNVSPEAADHWVRWIDRVLNSMCGMVHVTIPIVPTNKFNFVRMPCDGVVDARSFHSAINIEG